MPALHYHLAQANYSLWKPDIDPREVRTFTERLDAVNALAERSPGFVWRYVSAPGDPEVIATFNNSRAIFNMSVWLSPQQLQAFAFQGAHGAIMKRRSEWFESLPGAASVLWWVPAGHRPTVQEAWQKIDTINRHGPATDAFSFATLRAKT